MEHKITKLGKINPEFDVFKLKSALTKNDAGDWGYEPIEGNANGILRSTNFTNQGILDLSDVAYRTLKPQKLAEKKLSAGEIIIERSGGSDTQPVGRIGFITPEIADNNYAFANFIQRIAVDETIEPKYLYYCLQQMYEMGITASMQYQTTGIRNLDWKLYTKSILPKPKPEEQKAIATILSKVDEAIKATETSIRAAEKLKKSLMQNLLTGKLKPDGTWRKEDDFYKDEKFGNVPVGWEVKAIGDNSHCEINPNYKFTKGREYDFIPMEAVNDSFGGVTSPLEKRVIDGGGYTRYKKGDIIFAKITPCTENGKVALIRECETEIGFASTEFIVFSPKEIIDSLFFYYLLSSSSVHMLAVSLMEGTTGRQRVPWKVFKNRIFAPIPTDVNEQKAIALLISSVETQNQSKNKKIDSLKRVKKSLMQNLLTGKVRVDLSKIEKILKEI